MATPVTSAQVVKAWVAAEPEVCGGVVVSAAGENVGDLVMSGKEALNLPRRLEPLHDPLSSSGRLMGVFGPVIEALVLPMLDPGHDLPLGNGVASQFVGDEHTRCSTLLLEELAEQAFGGLLVPSRSTSGKIRPQCMVRPCVARGFRRAVSLRSCINVSGL